MNIIYYPDKDNVTSAIEQDEPLLVLISYDGETLITSQIDEAVEYHILLRKVEIPDTDFVTVHKNVIRAIDKYFRLVVDRSGALAPNSLAFVLKASVSYRNTSYSFFK